MYKTFQRRLQEKWYFFPIILIILTLALAANANYVHAENTTLISNETTPVVPQDNTTNNSVSVECMKETVQETNQNTSTNDTEPDVDPEFSVNDTTNQPFNQTSPKSLNNTTGSQMIHIDQVEPAQGWYIPQHTQQKSIFDTLSDNLSTAASICIKSIFVAINGILYAAVFLL